MSIIILPNGTALHMDQELYLLTELQRDIARIDDGLHPTPKDLADTPVLEHWALGMRMQPCLTGEVYGHPKLRSGARPSPRSYTSSRPITVMRGPLAASTDWGLQHPVHEPTH